MQIDLYNQNEFTKNGVRKLIASKEGVKSERGLYRLKVTKGGTALHRPQCVESYQGGVAESRNSV